MRRFLLPALLLAGLPAAGASADTAPFDLAGPTLTVTVTHKGETLPIAEVPQLANGDEVTIRADLPTDQSAHYLLVAAFLRGSTNPPPDKWFYKSETWKKKESGGLDLVVPPSAQQAVLFLAPATGGDFPTLRNAVQGRPGAFVRTSQDLNQASLDRSRLDAYLDAVRHPPAGPDQLAKITPMLARSLAVKINTDCLAKMPELQAACLLQNQEALVLNDGHSNAIADAVEGPGVDLALQLSATPQGGLGYYSPYIAAIRDIIGILGSFHTAKYQYIPALATQTGSRLGLILNAPPSFHNPKSVLVTALPNVAPPTLPPLQAAEDAAPLCAQSRELLLPVSGAPLVFSTQLAHDMALRVPLGGGRAIDLPATPDATRGGFVVQTGGKLPAGLKAPIDVTLHGMWGFEPFDGPSFHLQAAEPGQWTIADGASPIVGRDATVTLSGGAAACVAGVSMKGPSGAARSVPWKATQPGRIEVTLPLADAQPGALALLVSTHGLSAPDRIALTSYTQPAHLAGFTIHSGDDFATLTGGRLDQVRGVTVDGAAFAPGALTASRQSDSLRLEATDRAAVSGWQAGQAKTATIDFRDGRTATLPFTVGGPRFAVSLIAESVDKAASTTPVSIQLASDTEIPSDAIVHFSLRAAGGAHFDGGETVEVSAGSGGTPATLPALTLQDAHVAIATLHPARTLGDSAFGPLRFRVVRDGIAGDWQPLGTLVRLPSLHQLDCPADPAAGCRLTGDRLFLIAAVAATAGFETPVTIPSGYPGGAIQVPHPIDGALYVRLRDDPGVTSRITQ